MKRVYKYPVTIADWFTLRLPVDSEVLHVDTQHGTPFLWVLIDTDAPIGLRRFRLAGTGHDIDDLTNYLVYVGSFLMVEDRLVWHVFEEKGGNDGDDG